MNVNLSIYIGYSNTLHEKTSLSHYQARVIAEAHGIAECSSAVPIGEVPAHLLATGCTFQEVIESEWAKPLITEAVSKLKAKFAKLASESEVA